MELGTGESDSAELNFEFADAIGNRNFELKVTQIICNSNSRYCFMHNYKIYLLLYFSSWIAN